MKRTILFLLILVTLLSTTVFALTGNHANGVTWELDTDTMQFALGNTDEVYSRNKPLYGVAAVYNEKGQMISVGMAKRSADGAIYIDGSDCQLPQKYKIRFFLLDEENQPVTEAMTFSVGNSSPGGNNTPWG